MKYFIRNSLFFVVIFSINFGIFALQSEDISLKLERIEHGNAAIFEVILPDGWKMAKAPDIRSKSSGKEFQCSDNLKEIAPGTYEVSCELNPNKQDILNFNFFVCKEICSIVSKDILFNPWWFSLMMIFFGFIGGILLNFMPCVLPVLLLKLRQLRSKRSLHNTIIGNYLTFALLASILSLLKLSGETAGWGLHFQNIYFLKIITAFFFVLTLMVFKKTDFYFDINLDFLNKRFVLKDILQCMITTAVAIPCSAPFLGAAAAFAIQESVPDLFIIFFAIATGFSLPYIVVLFSNVTFQDKFKKLFQNSLFGRLIDLGVLLTFSWLLWILLKRVTFWESATIVAILGISGVLFCIKKAKSALVLLFVMILVSAKDVTSDDKFDEISRLIEKNKVVVVNISANWCLSCQFNKLKFTNDRVLNKMRETDAQFIEIDMTKTNDKALEFIKAHNRVGIPFTIVFGPKQKQGVLLSEMPSIPEIIEAIDLVK